MTLHGSGQRDSECSRLVGQTLREVIESQNLTEHGCVQKCGSHRQQEVSMLMLESRNVNV